VIGTLLKSRDRAIFLLITGIDFPSAVSALLTTADDEIRAQAESWLVAWQSSRDSLPIARDVVEQSFDQNLVFFAAIAIEHIIDRYWDTMDSAEIDGIFWTLITRLNSRISLVDEKCCNRLLTSLAVFSVHFPAYIDNWRNFQPSLILPYFQFLFEYLERFPHYSDDSISQIHSSLGHNVVIPVLCQNELSGAWFSLAKSVVPLLADECPLRRFFQFLPEFQTVLDQPDLFDSFFEFLRALLSIDDIDADEADFLQTLLEIGLTISGAVLTDGRAFSLRIVCEVLDYSTDFFLAPGRLDFTQAVISHINDLLPTIAESPSDFADLLESICSVYPLFVLEPLWPSLTAFFDLILSVLDVDFCSFLCRGVAWLFDALSPYLPFLSFLSDRLASPTPGLSVVVASLSPAVRPEFSLRLLDFVIDSLPPANVLYFIRECAPDLESVLDSIVNLTISSGLSPESADTLSALAAAFPSFFSTLDPELMSPIFRELPSASPYALIPLLPVLSHFPDAITSISESLTNAVSGFLSSEDIPSLFDLLGAFAKALGSLSSTDFRFSLSSSLSSLMRPLWSLDEDIISIGLCDFVIRAASAGVIDDYRPIMTWLIGSIRSRPVRDHYRVVRAARGLVEILDEYPEFLESLVNVGSCGDEDIIVEGYSLVHWLARVRWPLFFEVFSGEFLLAPLVAEDHRLIAVGLEVLSEIAGEDQLREGLEQIVNVMVEGMFARFGYSAIESVIRLFMRFVQGEMCTVNEILSVISAGFQEECREAEFFARAFRNGDDLHTLVSLARRLVSLNRPKN
jgi:hypothetical protein